MIEVCAERGASNVTVAHVVARSGVSRRTFYELFADREECLLAAFDEAVARASSYVRESYDAKAKWSERIRRALTGLLSFLDLEPCAGRLLIVESLGAGTLARERRQRVLAQMVALVDEGRTGVESGSPIDGQAGLSPLMAEGLVGGALSVIATRMLMGERRPLLELTGPLMSMIVMPYLGLPAARRELDRVALRPRSLDGAVQGDPLRDLEMRVTYRTVRVLLAIATEPGSSNREIGVASGVHDQGQISKLLGRLQRLGLVHNTGLAPGRGAPNAWMLTDKGVQVERAVSGDVDASQHAVGAGTGSRGGR